MIEPLTKRELEVLQASELEINSVAKLLHMSPKTVERNLHQAREKLGVTNTRAAIFVGFREGWLK